MGCIDLTEYTRYDTLVDRRTMSTQELLNQTMVRVEDPSHLLQADELDTATIHEALDNDEATFLTAIMDEIAQRGYIV